MSEGVDIPITIPGAEVAKLALTEIVASFSSLEQRTIALAAKSEGSAKAFEELKQKFIDGKVSADELRAALEKIAAQAPRAAEEQKKAAEEQKKALDDQKRAAEEAAAAQKKAADEAATAAEAAKKVADDAARRAANLRMPITVHGADLAKLAIDGIVGSFSTLEQRTIAVAEKSEVTAQAVADLKQNFVEGRLSAQEFHAALAHIATQSNAVEGAVRAASTRSAGFVERLTSAAITFNNVTTAASTLAGAVHHIASQAADLASEQQRLDRVGSSLGLNFQQASTAAGKYADALVSMTAAARLSEAGIRLTQEQVDSLMRVAGNYASTTGKDIRESVDQLTDALLNGEQEGLRRFGPALAAMGGSAHTAQERLGALVGVARTVPRATDDAADSIHRLEGNLRSATRELTAGFLDELQRLERESDQRFGAANNNAESFTDHMREIGQTGALVFHGLTGSINLVAEAMAHVVYSAGRVLEAISQIREHPLSIGDVLRDFDRDIAASRARVTGSFQRLTGAGDERTSAGGETREAIGGGRATFRPGAAEAEDVGPSHGEIFLADEAAETRKANIARRMALGGGGDPSKSRKAALLAAQQAERELLAARQAAAREYMENLARYTAEHARAVHDAADAWGEQVTHANELMRITARLRGLEQESVVAVETRLQRARMAQQRAEGGVAAGAEIADLRDPETRRARMNEMRQQRELQRERTHLEQRYRLNLSFAERMQDLHDTEASGWQGLAEGVTSATQTMTGALAEHITALAKGDEDVADALQGMLSDTLTAISKEATVKAAFETAEGIAALAGIYTAALAPGHFAAAAAYAGVAALTGVAGYATRTASMVEADNKGGGGASREPAAKLGKGSAEAGGVGAVYNINFGGPMYGTGGTRQAAREIVGAINRGAVQGGVQLLPGALMGGGAGA